MIISGANLSLAASHRSEAGHERSEKLKTWTGARPRERATPPATPAPAPVPNIQLGEALAKLRHQQSAALSDYQSGRLARQARQNASSNSRNSSASDGATDPQQDKTILLLEKLFGVKGIKQFSMRLDGSSSLEIQSSSQQSTTQQSGGGGPVGWGLEYDYHEAYHEHESTSLAMAGTFTTQDGRAFSFSIDYQMERDYTRTTDLSVRAGDAVVKDPLILDTSGQGGFGTTSRPFDLDGQGNADALRQLTNGNQYLAADLDGNGRIDNGGELFGPSSGNGFTDLAKHDDDHNGFIDEGDAIWKQLRLWSGDGAKPTLLAQWNIAAISLQSVAAQFSYKDGNNALIGENRRAGVYLKDDGQAGVVKQVDLVA